MSKIYVIVFEYVKTIHKTTVIKGYCHTYDDAFKYGHTHFNHWKHEVNYVDCKFYIEEIDVV